MKKQKFNNEDLRDIFLIIVNCILGFVVILIGAFQPLNIQIALTALGFFNLAVAIYSEFMRNLTCLMAKG